MTRESGQPAPQVAVAVVSWNTRELLRGCLASLAPGADAGNASVWVVDNASSDGSPELVRREFPWVRFVASDENLGFGRAVNLVAERTSEPWIAPANADVALEPGALEALLAAGSADPEAAIVAPRLVMPDGETQHSVHAFPTVSLAAVIAGGLYRLVPGLGERLCLEGHWTASVSRRVDWAHGAFLLVRREAFEATGGFDPQQWMYAEDLDLAWRSRSAGWRVRYEPAAAVRHEVSAAASQAFGDRRLDAYMRATYAWMVRRRGLFVTWVFAVVSATGAVIRWFGFSALAVRRPRRWAAKRALARVYVRVHLRGLKPRSALLAATEKEGGDLRLR